MSERNAINHPSKSSPPKSDKTTSNNPLPNFIYKAIFVVLFIALLPIFPSSQFLEISDNSFLARSWELLQLLLVGVAISYGLFSRLNSDHELEKETQTQLKPDLPQSYISEILQVSSVFDDDEDLIKSPEGLEFTKHSQYYREEPVVMVAKENSDDINRNTKPLSLPVRSLKSVGYELDGRDDNVLNGGKERTVLSSPIPWRSRSGKIESPKLDNELGYSRTSSFQETRGKMKEETSHSRTPSFRSINPSLTQEIRGKTNEDLGRKKSFQKSSIPPPPQPPPLPHNYSSSFISEKKYARKSFKDELENLGRVQRGEIGLSSFNAEKNLYSVRSVRPKEEQNRPPLHRNKSEKKDEFREKMIIDSESESDGDDSELSDVEAETPSTPKEEKQEENEVDKKADEFIAKFREQIRLQRIASIKKSSGQRSTRNSK